VLDSPDPHLCSGVAPIRCAVVVRLDPVWPWRTGSKRFWGAAILASKRTISLLTALLT